MQVKDFVRVEYPHGSQPEYSGTVEKIDSTNVTVKLNEEKNGKPQYRTFKRVLMRILNQVVTPDGVETYAIGSAHDSLNPYTTTTYITNIFPEYRLTYALIRV